MKRVIALFVSLLLLFSLCACAGTGEQLSTQPTESQPTAPKSLKVLAIGNSFSVDAMTHLYQVAKAEGVEEVVLGNFFIGACTFKQHAEFMKSGEPAYRYDKCTDGTWIQTPDTALITGLLDEQWDVITLQQASHDSHWYGDPRSARKCDR